MLLCLHQLRQSMKLNSSTLTDISATLTSSVLLPMDLELFVILISTTRIILLYIPDIVVEKKAKSPDEHKSLADSKALLPTLKNFKTRRGSKEWDETYKIRVNVEKSINHFKDSFCIAKRKTTNEKTLHSDLLLAGISQLLTVVVADNINLRQHIRSLKSLIA